MKIVREKNIEIGDGKRNIYIIWDDRGRYYKGISKCHDEDSSFYSPLIGGEIAHLRALQKYLRAELKFLSHMPLDDKECEKRVKEIEKQLNTIPITIGTLVGRHIKSKELVKSFKKRKEEGFETWRDKYEKQMEDLHKYIKEVKKMP